MATRSRIGIKDKLGNIKSVYCHWDGYPSNNGKLLLEHYDTKEKVKDLINLGDISILAESIECPKGHTFETPKENCTVFYGRDRGETDIEPISGLAGGEEYDYVFDVKKNKWTYRESGGRFKILTENACKDKF